MSASNLFGRGTQEMLPGSMVVKQGGERMKGFSPLPHPIVQQTVEELGPLLKCRCFSEAR